MFNTYLSLLSVALFCSAASATTLTFSDLNGNIPTNLGSNATVSGMGYIVSGSSDQTPDVSVNLATLNPDGTLDTPTLALWSANYGDLLDVAYPAYDGHYARVTLSTASGFLVTVNSFELAGYPNSDLLAARIRIYDGSNNLLWNQDNSVVIGASPAVPRHSTYTPNITAPTLILEYGTNYNIGLDNLTFTQSVPEPTMAALSLTALTFLRRRRRTLA